MLHHRTGVKRPEFDFSEFQAKFWAFNQLVESHYRYYQFYSHMFLALAFLIGTRLVTVPWPGPQWFGVALTALEVVLLFSGRQTLAKYYASASHLLGVIDKPRSAKKKRNVSDGGGETKQNQSTNGGAVWDG